MIFTASLAVESWSVVKNFKKDAEIIEVASDAEDVLEQMCRVFDSILQMSLNSKPSWSQRLLPRRHCAMSVAELPNFALIYAWTPATVNAVPES
jgi:hypothetical protein